MTDVNKSEIDKIQKAFYNNKRDISRDEISMLLSYANSLEKEIQFRLKLESELYALKNQGRGPV